MRIVQPMLITASTHQKMMLPVSIIQGFVGGGIWSSDVMAVLPIVEGELPRPAVAATYLWSAQ